MSDRRVLIGMLLLTAFAVAAWFVVGSRLAPVSTPLGGSSLLSYEERADGAVRITNSVRSSSASDQNPCVIDDGRTIVFTRFANGYNRGPSALVRLDLATGKETVIVDDGVHDHVNSPSGCVDPATNTLIFASDREGLEELWTIRTDGSNLSQLTEHTDTTRYLEPVFSPDGHAVAFEVDPIVVGDVDPVMLDDASIALVDRSSPHTRDSLSVAGPPVTRQPSYAPAGRLVFQGQSIDGSEWELYVRGTDGTMQNISQAPSSDETDASWFPDGEWIVTSSNFGGLTHPSLFAFPSDGGIPIRLTNDPTHEDGAPSVSPDGQWVVFESHRTANETSPTDLWLIELSGSFSIE